MNPRRDRLQHAFGIIYEEPVSIRIYFTPQQAPYIRERQWHPSQQVEEQEDGGIILSLYAGGFYETKSWVLSHGEDARVIEPESLRQAILDELRSSLAAYEKNA